jgi:hypothetical protein
MPHSHMRLVMTRCDTCGSGAFWTSKTGARVCYRCHPAADDALAYLAVETRRVGCDLAALRQQIADRFNEPVTFGPPHPPCPSCRPARVDLGGGRVEAFLREYPDWRDRGVYVLVSDTDGPPVAVLTQAAAVAMTAWELEQGFITRLQACQELRKLGWRASRVGMFPAITFPCAIGKDAHAQSTWPENAESAR